ncbi:MAG: ATP-binding protein, partial [Candidatus Binataceae bacterium]
GARRLMDGFDIQTANGQGAVVCLKKLIRSRAKIIDDAELSRIAAALGANKPRDVLEEMRLQNQELMRTLEELQHRQEELTRLNLELEDTNRGVVALYAELDEKADHLRRADELKSKFLSNMSHEFRTPLNSITGLCRLLLEDDGQALPDEQQKQVRYIQHAAEDLQEIVNDLLDIAKVEAGKVTVNPAEFEAGNLFGALRGMLRPLLVTGSAELVFENPGVLVMRTDEAKVSQILRNFLSNAIKFTERGEIRVSAKLADDGNAVVFAVADTGIGIAHEDQQRIFDEFAQVEGPAQKKVKGTGLGLPLARKLAELLGGSVTVVSAPGAGSTFSAAIPLAYPGARPAGEQLSFAGSPDAPVILIVEDRVADLLLYENFLHRSPFAIVSAKSLSEARRVLAQIQPKAIILDILLPDGDAWGFLAELKRAERTREIPVVVCATLDDQRKGIALGADSYAIKPIAREWLTAELARLTGIGIQRKILVIDDEAVSRYLLKHMLADPRYIVAESGNGFDGIVRARQERPDVIFLDLVMSGTDGFEVLDLLKRDPQTASIPVVLISPKFLAAGEKMRVADKAFAILPKRSASRESIGGILSRIFAGAQKNSHAENAARR